MKIRTGFVSNSSTSSYICGVCGSVDAASDCVAMSDLGFEICQHGHEFETECSSLKIEDHYPEVRDYIIKYYQEHIEFCKRQIEEKDFKYTSQEKYEEDIQRTEANVQFLHVMDFKKEDDIEGLMELYDDSDYCYEVPEFLCPVCQLEGLNSEYTYNYLRKRDLIVESELFEEIKRRFTNFKEFQKYLNE